jgi:hypothetical protein
MHVTIKSKMDMGYRSRRALIVSLPLGSIVVIDGDTFMVVSRMDDITAIKDIFEGNFRYVQCIDVFVSWMPGEPPTQILLHPARTVSIVSLEHVIANVTDGFNKMIETGDAKIQGHLHLPPQSLCLVNPDNRTFRLYRHNVFSLVLDVFSKPHYTDRFITNTNYPKNKKPNE